MSRTVSRTTTSPVMHPSETEDFLHRAAPLSNSMQATIQASEFPTRSMACLNIARLKAFLRRQPRFAHYRFQTVGVQQ
ncbi:hypothetical protein AURDEDRAFT_175299 [Auricularia subglabra TFB-10046 SS5]|uniref:Uncharacterized protein n=1 Tax=Auricularia subglabra (strain TFB-10046 / SS5) TaxID=717982 RepID=J0CXT2_AURST|nr:hypothetical protein AURDEDRAFT_175299 [Auricularia subglabra TFB-10046 SS5]